MEKTLQLTLKITSEVILWPIHPLPRQLPPNTGTLLCNLCLLTVSRVRTFSKGQV